MDASNSPLPPTQRCFDDFSVGEPFEFGAQPVSAEEIIDFARRYDPQPFHLDSVAAAATHFGGLVASGWMRDQVQIHDARPLFIRCKSLMLR